MDSRLDVTIVVATYGDEAWRETAQRAVLSAQDQAPVLQVHRSTLAEARNAGAARANSDHLIFLDADDELTPGYVDAMATGTADLRGPAVEYVHGKRARRRVWPEVDLTDGNYLVIGTLVPRALFLRVGGFKDWPLYEDWCLWQRCWKAGATIETIPAAVYRAHVRLDSRNRAPGRDEREHWHHEIRRSNFPELYTVAA